MGLNERSNNIFINVANGKLVTGPKDNKKEYISYTGKLLAIEAFTDEYEGKPINKIKCTFNDGHEPANAIISFTEDSWYGVGFFSRILNCDISKPITLGVSNSEQNEKVSFCWMKQGDKKIEKHPDVVTPTKTTKKGIRGAADTVVYDWVPFMEFSEKTMAWVKEELYKANHTDQELRQDAAAQEATNTIGKQKNRVEAEGEGEDDGLPF